MDDDEGVLPPSNDRQFTLLPLAIFTQLCGEHDIEVGVSLLVSGTWISGTLTSFRRYIDGVTSQVSQAKGPAGEAFARGWTSAMEKLVGHLLDEPFHDDLAVYLRDAHFWMPDGTEASLPVVTIRRDSVDAFQFGEMRTSR